MSPPRIPVAQPALDGREKEYVLECLETGWISSLGRFIGDFERAFADYCGVKHAVACNNGTTALHLALVALGIGPGDEVIVPTLTYVASANCVAYCGAVPVFVDSEPDTMNLDPAKLEAAITPRTRAIMPVHLYGHPAEMDPIREIAARHGVAVVEDAAESVGATYRGVKTGALSDLAMFSLFGNKIITSGEGGMIVTDDDALNERLRLYRNQGNDPARRYWHSVIGYNYRMTNVTAAIGLAQLERVEHHLAARRRVAAGYDARLAGLADRLATPVTRPWVERADWMYNVVLAEGARRGRDAVMAAMAEAGIETRPVFYPIHGMPPYAPSGQGPFPVADSLSARGVSLPTYGALTDADLDRVVEALARALD
jgi:perosamine synthetase